MNGRELTTKIHRRLCAGVKTVADKKEFLKLDEEIRTFMQSASNAEQNEFLKKCHCLEMFDMIVLAIGAGKKNFK